MTMKRSILSQAKQGKSASGLIICSRLSDRVGNLHSLFDYLFRFPGRLLSRFLCRFHNRLLHLLQGCLRLRHARLNLSTTHSFRELGSLGSLLQFITGLLLLSDFWLLQRSYYNCEIWLLRSPWFYWSLIRFHLLGRSIRLGLLWLRMHRLDW